MLRSRVLLVFLVSCSAIACGSSSDGSSRLASRPPTAPVRLGSYDVSSSGENVWRMDLADDGVAIWPVGETTGFVYPASVMTQEGDTLTIDAGDGDVFSFPLAQDGSFVGTFEETFVSSTSTGTVAPSTFTGTIAPDRTAPFVDVGGGASGGTWPPLPWEAVELRVSEPVDPAALTAAISFRTADVLAASTEPLLQRASKGPTPRMLTEQANVGVVLWSRVAGTTASLELKPLFDLAGNGSAAASLPLSFVDVPRRGAIDFADAAASFVLFDSYGEVVFRGADPVCETSDCLELGPFYPGGCTYASMRMATWLAAGSMRSGVAVRYRILTTGVASPVSPKNLTSRYEFVLAAEGAAPTRATLDDEPAALSPTTDLGFEMTTDWRTAHLALPIATENVGLELQGGGPCGEDRVHANPLGSAVLLISSITAE